MENSLLNKRLGEHIEVAKEMWKDEKIAQQVSLVTKKIVECYKKGGKTVFFGNGGSAADAQHAAAEFMGKYLKDRKPLASLALTTNTSALTAIGNDYGYEDVFKRQLEGLLKKEDVVIGISTSGNSPNVVKAIECAKSRGVFAIAFVGAKKCRLEDIADVCIKVPSESTPRIQEMHEFLLHTICEMVERELFS
ncbi:MAG: SIS domain-containing protein [Candidatus Bilamarchaeaceae archaeon]